MKIGTWNVNGIRARVGQLLDWIERDRPDVVCVQEIKASIDQLPMMLCDIEGYWCYWHGGKGYSGVGLHVSKARWPEKPLFHHPEFDFEHRIVTVDLGDLTVASIYVPNGGKDFPAKMQFLAAMEQMAAAAEHAARQIVLCGDLNVARTDRDVHPKERKPNLIGQRPDERELLERIIGHSLVDVGRAVDPDNDDLFTWWAPWRNMRQRNIGWRLDYVLASTPLAGRVVACPVLTDIGTSDHAPVMVTFSEMPATAGPSAASGPSGASAPRDPAAPNAET